MMLSFRGIAIVFFLCAGFPEFASAEVRTWRDNTGKFSVEAELLRVRGDSVVLEKANGSEIRVPVSRLSEADHMYLKSFGSENIEADSIEDDWSPVTGVWKPYHQFLAKVNQLGKTGERRIGFLRWIAGFVPESWKGNTALYLMSAALLLFPFAYIWILKREFDTNLLWGVAQLTADIGAACLAPFLGIVVTLFFAIGNIGTAWKAVLLYTFVTILAATTFFFVPSHLYEGLPEKKKTEGFEKDLKELRDALELLKEEF